MTSESPYRLFRELTRAWAIAKKDFRLYYLPPGLMAITIFFSASSTGPMAVPTERKSKTYDRLITAPISPFSILLGETLGGFVFGGIIASVPLVIGIVWYGIEITNPLALILGIGLTSFCFSAMGIMFAAIPTENPGDVMMVLNFIRLPLLFVSGIFIPIKVWDAAGLLIYTCLFFACGFLLHERTRKRS